MMSRHGDTLPGSSLFVRLLAFLFPVLVFLFTLEYRWRGPVYGEYQRSVALSRAFLHGRLFLFESGQRGEVLDTVVHNGHYYWPLSPVPAVLLMPIVGVCDAAGIRGFRQSYVELLLSLVLYGVAFRAARRAGADVPDALGLSSALCFASNILPVIIWPGDWQFAQILTLIFGLLGLNEHFGRRRPWMIGAAMAVVFAIRPTAGIMVSFFLLEALFNSPDAWRKRVLRCVALVTPICFAAGLLALYNEARFGSYFDNGYRTALISPQFYALARERYGLFSFRNVLTNVYWYFLAGPTPVTEPDTYHLVFPYVRPNPIGMSFFILSPIFLRLLWKRPRDRQQIFLWISSLAILGVLLTYYSTGFSQIGPRYMLDLMPLWYVLLLRSFEDRRLGVGAHLFIVVSAGVNLFFALSGGA